MRVTFRDAKLAAVRTAMAAQTGLPFAVISSFQRKVIVLEAAPDERTLRNWKSLHYEKLVGDRAGQRSIRLNDKWRVVFLLDDASSPATIEILAIEDYHR